MPLILEPVICGVFVLLKARGQQENWRSLLTKVSLLTFGDYLALGTVHVLTLTRVLGLIFLGRAGVCAVSSMSKMSYSCANKGHA